jgi:hypothetical protein
MALAAQNCHHKTSGAFTGEVSVDMLKSVGVSFVIIGHSERRMYFQETNAQLAEKTNLLLEKGMRPIFCCGESLEQREKGIHIDFVRQQLQKVCFIWIPVSYKKSLLLMSRYGQLVPEKQLLLNRRRKCTKLSENILPLNMVKLLLQKSVFCMEEVPIRPMRQNCLPART